MLLIVFGILFNKWILEFLLSQDQQIGSSLALTIIGSVELVAVLLGIYLVAKGPRVPFQIKDIALTVSSVAIALGILEIGCRTWLEYYATEQQKAKYLIHIDPTQFKLAAHHYLNYYLNPQYAKGRVTYNSLGYRDREFEVEKPAGVYRIVALGGSTTYTSGVRDNAKTFTSQLGETLKDYEYDAIEVINAGVEGYNSWESLINLEFRVLDLKPDLVIVYHGRNDVDARLVPPSSYRGDNSGRRKQWNEPHVPFLYRHSFLLRVVDINLHLQLYIAAGRLRFFVTNPNTGPQAQGDLDAVLEENPPIYLERNLRNMVAVARAHGVRVLLTTWAYTPEFNDYAVQPHYIRGYREGNDVVRKVAQSMGTYYFDFASLMPDDKKFWVDGMHVNEDGALMKAQLFAKYIHEAELIPPRGD